MKVSKVVVSEQFSPGAFVHEHEYVCPTTSLRLLAGGYFSYLPTFSSGQQASKVEQRANQLVASPRCKLGHINGGLLYDRGEERVADGTYGS